MYFICSVCKKDLKELPRPLGLCECGKPLEVHYSWENQPVSYTHLTLPTNREV